MSLYILSRPADWLCSCSLRKFEFARLEAVSAESFVRVQKHEWEHNARISNFLSFARACFFLSGGKLAFSFEVQ